MKNGISLGYLPINSNGLKTDTMIGCDLYLLVKIGNDSRYVLYSKGDTVFEKNKREKLLEKNISRLFIKKEDRKKFYEYLETNFQSIISDSRISPDERTKIVYDAATNLAKDLFNDPRIGSIERVKTFAYNMVDCVLKDSRIAHSLIKIAIHEYYTYTHSVNVSAIGTLFVENLGFGVKDLRGFCSGILLHDIGKTKISTDILKKKGKLTEEEFDVIKRHPELGVEVLKETGSDLKDEYIVALQHHENVDGSGYPYGLKNNEIHRCGKIASIIDTYDGLTTNRPYGEAVRPFAALLEMKKKMLNRFDTEMFKEFIRFLGPYDPREKKRKSDILQN